MPAAREYNENIMTRRKRRTLTAAAAAVLALIAALTALYAYPALTGAEQAQPRGYAGVLRLWHIDGFEGGKGSRVSFLARAAKAYEEEEEGVLVMIVPHSAESAAAALSEGEPPDMLSFSGGFSAAADLARPLGYSFAPAEAGGDTLAVPWCRGGYALFTAEGDFSDISAENTVISSGRENFPAAAAALGGLRGGFDFLPVSSAYTSLIGGKYRYMLGTQRDVWRFATRGFAVRVQPLTAFNDLWQYICICTDVQPRYAACMRFLRCLLSEKVQKSLTSVGMLSPYFSVYDESDPAMAALEEPPARSLYAFLDDDARARFGQAALELLNGAENGAKILKNYLA